MNVDGKPYRTIWSSGDDSFEVIDQTKLPSQFAVARITTAEQAADAIRRMVVRGAPLIGATAAWGIAVALRRDPSGATLTAACELLLATRPTGRNLFWAVDRVRSAVEGLPQGERTAAARRLAERICDEDVAINRAIGEHGLELLRQLRKSRPRSRPAGRPLEILTHCNAGWLATVDCGTALAPVYLAHDAGLPVHVWVTETRPRNQGAALTAWELKQHGVPHTVVVDGAAGHLMQRGRVDCCLVGTDRTTAAGEVCNKIGTYPLALAARDNDVPLYVALPGPTIDWSVTDAVAEIAIEERDAGEVTHVAGRASDGTTTSVMVTPAGSPAANPAFDVTPARLVTALVTERGACAPSELEALYARGAPLRAR